MMKRLLLAFLLGFAVPSFAAISFVAEGNCVDSTTGGDATCDVTKPTGTVDGDMLIAYVFGSRTGGSGTPTLVEPAGGGWTVVTEDGDFDGGANRIIGVYYKIAASEGASYTWAATLGTSTANYVGVSIITLRGTGTQLNVTYSEPSHHVDDGDNLNPDAPDITTATDNAWVVTGMGASHNEITAAGAPSGYTLRSSNVTMTYNKIMIATKSTTTAGAQSPGVWTNTGTLTNTDSSGITIAVPEASGFPAACAGGRTAVGITSIADAGDADNLLYGLSPAAVANEDTVCYDPSSVLGDTVNVSTAGWPSIASSGSQLTDSFDYCVMDNGAACGTDGTYEVTFQPVITSVTGIGTGQTTGTVTVTPAGPTEGTVRGVAILKSVYDLYGPPDHDQIAAGVDANYDGVSWGSEFTSDLATPDVWTNLATYSEQFDNAAWTKNRSSISLNSTTAPDGSSAADTLIEDGTASATHYMRTAAAKAASAIQYTHSVYLKQKERAWVAVCMGYGGNPVDACVYANLAAGTLGGSGSSAFSGVTSAIQDAGNGWYRVSITATSNTDTSIQVAIAIATSDGGFIYSGDGTSGIYLWGAQLEAASTAGPYTPTTTAAVARFDGYTFSRASSQTYEKSDGTLGTVTSGNPAFTYSGGTAQGVLLEGARTNLAKYSDDLSNAVWVATNITKGSTSTTGIYGSAITTVEATASAANGTLLQTVTASSKAYTYSTYLKRKTGTGNIDITVNGGTGWTTCTVTASWSPCSVTATVTNPQIGIRIVTSGDAVYMQGSQVEAGSFRSSTIYTTTGSVARQPTSLTRSWNFPSNDFSGQIVVRPQYAYTEVRTGWYSVLTLRYDASNYFRVLINPGNDMVHVSRRVAGAAGETSTSAGELSFARNELLNIRFRADTTGLYLWVDDSNSSTVDSCTSADCKASFVTPPNAIRLGDYSADSPTNTDEFLTIESLTIWNEAKSDAFLEALE